MELKCTNPECEREWTYTGKKTYPAYATCPDCHRNVRLPKVTGDEVCEICGAPALWLETYDIENDDGTFRSDERYVCEIHRTLRIRAEDANDSEDVGDLVDAMYEQDMDDSWERYCGEEPEAYATPIQSRVDDEA